MSRDSGRPRRPSCANCPRARHLTRFCPATPGGQKLRRIEADKIVSRVRARRE